MSLIRWSPFEPFDGMEKFLDSFPAAARGGLMPAVDVYDRADAVVVETALPGVKPEQVELSIENNILTVRGSSQRKTEVDEKDYYRKEIRSGQFMRQVALPAGVKEDGAQASFKDGILSVTIPKLEAPKAKAIKIDVTHDT